MDGELMTGKVIRYFKRNWWLIYPEGKFKAWWDYLICIVVVVDLDSDVCHVCHTCQDQLLY
jgi:hypothetical protein